MKFIKQFESFVNDSNRDSQSIDFFPKYNPIIRQKAKEYVEDLISKKYEMVFKLANMDLPKDLDSENMDEIFDIAKERAIDYLVENPEAINNDDYVINAHPKGDGIPRLQNIGGSSHANSRFVGENSQFIDSITIKKSDMNLFDTEEPLIELIRNNKIKLENCKIKFDLNDDETREILDIYFEIP